LQFESLIKRKQKSVNVFVFIPTRGFSLKRVCYFTFNDDANNGGLQAISLDVGTCD